MATKQAAMEHVARKLDIMKTQYDIEYNGREITKVEDQIKQEEARLQAVKRHQEMMKQGNTTFEKKSKELKMINKLKDRREDLLNQEWELRPILEAKRKEVDEMKSLHLNWHRRVIALQQWVWSMESLIKQWSKINQEEFSDEEDWPAATQSNVKSAISTHALEEKKMKRQIRCEERLIQNCEKEVEELWS